jgi:hypothetical protein
VCSIVVFIHRDRRNKGAAVWMVGCTIRRSAIQAIVRVVLL